MNELRPQPWPDNPNPTPAEIYRAYADSLYRYALMILADPFAAEDATHRVFEKLIAQNRALRKIESWDIYLRTAVRNECFRIFQDRQRKNIHLDSDVPFLETIDPSGTGSEEKAVVENALRQLPPEQREVVHLKIYEEKTFQQIADLLGISLNTAASRYRYAMDKLRQLLSRLNE